MCGYEVQASTHEHDNMRMQGCKWGHKKLRIWGCKDVKAKASTHEHKDIRCEDARIQASAQEWGCGDINKSKISNM